MPNYIWCPSFWINKSWGTLHEADLTLFGMHAARKARIGAKSRYVSVDNGWMELIIRTAERVSIPQGERRKIMRNKFVLFGVLILLAACKATEPAIETTMPTEAKEPVIIATMPPGE